MKLKKVLSISKIVFLFTIICVFSIAHASIVTGTLSSEGISSTGSTLGSGSSGSQVVGTLGGGNSISGTVSGGLSSITGSVRGGGSGNDSLALSGTVTGGQTTLAQNSTGNVTTNEVSAKEILPADTTSGTLTQETGNGAASILADAGVANTNNQNTNQLASALTSGYKFGSWFWWVFIIFLFVILGYIMYKFYNKDNNYAG